MAVAGLHHVICGAGDPTLVFVHGLACSHQDWEAQVQALSSRHRCVNIDLPGHGASPAKGPLGIARFGELVAVLAREQCASPCVLVGHSMGCRVVLEAARLLGDAVAGLVLVDGARRGIGAEPQVRADAEARIRAAGFGGFISGLFSAMFTDASDAEVRERIIERALKLDPQAGVNLVVDMVGWDAGEMEDALDHVQVPLLVIQSTNINGKPLRPGQRTPWTNLVSERVPGAVVEVISGVGHFSMLEAPEQVTTLMARFLDSISPAGTSQA
jgi:pimeloyl-ACP methyl ester carboxylesterase